MSSSKTPILFSTAFKIDPAKLAAAGVFDPTLNIDTLLFPDPLLCETSQHPEIVKARQTFEDHFEQVRKLLYGSKGKEGPALKAARRKLTFPEIKGTCLGYGSDGIAGSGSGPKMTEQLIETGVEIVKLGIDDPDLFLAMGLFEKNFGPDLVGDMFTNIALRDIAKFNKRIEGKFGYARRLTARLASVPERYVSTTVEILPQRAYLRPAEFPTRRRSRSCPPNPSAWTCRRSRPTLTATSFSSKG